MPPSLLLLEAMPSWFQGDFKFVVLPKEAVLPGCYFNFSVLAQVSVGCVMNHIKKKKKLY